MSYLNLNFVLLKYMFGFYRRKIKEPHKSKFFGPYPLWFQLCISHRPTRSKINANYLVISSCINRKFFFKKNRSYHVLWLILQRPKFPQWFVMTSNITIDFFFNFNNFSIKTTMGFEVYSYIQIINYEYNICR